MASGNSNGSGHHPGPTNGGMPKNTVPIIGAAIEVVDYFITVSLLCRCDPAHPMPLLFVGVIGRFAICPRCKHAHMLVGVRQDPQNPTQLQFVINSGIIQPKAAAEPPATEPGA